MLIRFTGPRKESAAEEPSIENNNEAQETAALNAYNEALVSQAAGRPAEAAASHARALHFASDRSSQVKRRVAYLAHKNLGTIHQQQSEHQLAVDHLAAALAIDASSATVWFQLAATLISNQQLHGALRALEQTIRLRPSHQLAHERLVEVRYVLGDLGGCKEVNHHQ